MADSLDTHHILGTGMGTPDTVDVAEEAEEACEGRVRAVCA